MDITIPSTVEAVGANMFQQCYSLKNVNLTKGIKRIDKDAFTNCTSLKGLTIPDSITYIGENAFKGCDFLVSIDIPGSVETIDSYAFVYCTNLKVIRLPSTLRKCPGLGQCRSLTDVYFAGTEEEYNNLQGKGKINLNIDEKKVTLHFSE